MYESVELTTPQLKEEEEDKDTKPKSSCTCIINIYGSLTIQYPILLHFMNQYYLLLSLFD
jgi:hypothetical protein